MEPRPTASSAASRRAFVVGTASAGAALALGRPRSARAEGLKSIVIAEPVHSAGYAPLYLAIQQGFFAKRGLDVSTLTASGGAHVTALVSGQVWGNIGGPESDAMANVGKADPLHSICNVVNRAMNYMMAKKGLAPRSSSNADIAAMMKGKRMAFSRYGGTPDLCGRWYLKKLGLDANREVTIVNQSDSSAAPLMIKQNVVDIAISQEPQITYGKEMGIWGDPFFSFPSLGDYSYSVISVRRSTITSDPKTVQAFTDALVEALKVAATNRSAVEALIHKEFPTLAESGVKGLLDRCYADHIWSPNGVISPKGFALDMDVVYTSGEFTTPVAFNSVIDMQFVKRSKA